MEVFRRLEVNVSSKPTPITKFCVVGLRFFMSNFIIEFCRYTVIPLGWTLHHKYK